MVPPSSTTFLKHTTQNPLLINIIDITMFQLGFLDIMPVDLKLEINSQLSYFRKDSIILVSCTPCDQILTTAGHLCKVYRGTY